MSSNSSSPQAAPRIERAPDTLAYPIDGRPGDGEVMRVAEGVLWVRMPIPFKGLDYINLWLLEDGDGWTIVDAGFRSSRIKELWQEVFAAHLDGKPVKRLICTHFHPDHIGLAGWIARMWKVELTMTFGEWAFGRVLSLDHGDEVPEDVLDFYRRVGLPTAMIDEIKARGFDNFRKAVSEIPRSFRRISDGERLSIGGRDWTVMVGSGHSQEHACLYCPDLKVLISGDQVLPRISPHIGVYPVEPEANPLKCYIRSLDVFRPLPEDTLVLPAHRDPFIGLHRRLDELGHHHDVRLEDLYAACAEPIMAIDSLPVLFRRELKDNDRFLALSEALAHLNYLLGEGRIVRETGPDGVYRYRQADGA